MSLSHPVHPVLQLNERYDITGIDKSGRRFSFSTGNYDHAIGFNLWRGSVWRVTKDIGTKTTKRELIKRVTN